MSTNISVANNKGGVAKTTTTITVSHCCALHQYRVLIVDCDPQGQCSNALGLPSEPGLFRAISAMVSGVTDDVHQWIRKTGRMNLDILPGNDTTAMAQVMLGAEKGIDVISTLLAPLRKEYDYIFLDTAPSAGGIQERACYAAKYVLCPTATEYLSNDGLAQLAGSLWLKNTSLKNQHGWSGSLLGVLPTFYDESTSVSKESLEQLQTQFGNEVFPVVHRATVLRECVAEGKTIFEYDPAHRASREYESVTAEIIKRS